MKDTAKVNESLRHKGNDMKKVMVNIIVMVATFVSGICLEQLGIKLNQAEKCKLIESESATNLKITIPNITEPHTESPTHSYSSRTPYELKEMITNKHIDLMFLWNELNIDSGKFQSCDNTCEAEIDEKDLNDEKGKEVILKLTQSFQYCRYLIFKKETDKQLKTPMWRLLAHIDHDFNHYVMSQHNVMKSGKNNWLVISGQEMSGSDGALFYERWYKVSSKGIRNVLNYPAEGALVNLQEGFCNRYASKIILHRDNLIEIRYTMNTSDVGKCKYKIKPDKTLSIFYSKDEKENFVLKSKNIKAFLEIMSPIWELDSTVSLAFGFDRNLESLITSNQKIDKRTKTKIVEVLEYYRK